MFGVNFDAGKIMELVGVAGLFTFLGVLSKQFLISADVKVADRRAQREDVRDILKAEVSELKDELSRCEEREQFDREVRFWRVNQLQALVLRWEALRRTCSHVAAYLRDSQTVPPHLLSELENIEAAQKILDRIEEPEKPDPVSE
jgi:hypothetical protein